MSAASCWCGRTATWPGAAIPVRPIRSRSSTGCGALPRSAPRSRRRRMLCLKTGEPMDEISEHPHGAHSHGGRTHVHASVDHLAGAAGASARLGIRLDAALMQTLGVAPDDIVRIATERGRSILARLDAPL